MGPGFKRRTLTQACMTLSQSNKSMNTVATITLQIIHNKLKKRDKQTFN